MDALDIRHISTRALGLEVVPSNCTLPLGIELLPEVQTCDYLIAGGFVDMGRGLVV
jgi:hypothetical protein